MSHDDRLTIVDHVVQGRSFRARLNKYVYLLGHFLPGAEIGVGYQVVKMKGVRYQILILILG